MTIDENFEASPSDSLDAALLGFLDGLPITEQTARILQAMDPLDRQATVDEINAVRPPDISDSDGVITRRDWLSRLGGPIGHALIEEMITPGYMKRDPLPAGERDLYGRPVKKMKDNFKRTRKPRRTT